MRPLRPEDLVRHHPELDYVVAEGSVSSPYMVAIHEAFYQFAANRLNGGPVLDAGCGTGLGSRFLARQDGGAIAFDVKPLLLRYGRQMYREGSPGLEFVAMEAGRLGFRDAAFTAVIVDELLEHLPEHCPFLDEAHRVLAPGGHFICATVNRAHTFGSWDDPLNPHHYREFDAVSFRSELERYFEVEVLLGQGFGEEFGRYMGNRGARAIEWLLMRTGLKLRIPTSWRLRVRSWITGSRLDRLDAGDFGVHDRQVEESLYLVAVCRKSR